MFKRPTIDNILFSELTNITPINKEKAVEEILQIPEEFWYDDEYRNARMVTIMSKGGLGGRTGANLHRPGTFEWTEYCPKIVSEWFDNNIFNWLSQRTRITVIKTEPGSANFDHIDSAEEEYGTRQHKLRYVLRGRTDSLYYITAKGKIFVPNIENPFIMDGSWYHGMINDYPQSKITLALGGPWCGESSYPQAIHHMKRSDYSPVENFRDFFDPKLKVIRP